MAEFRMPSLGADMDAGRLLEWYVKPGDPVHRGDIVALVDTDKAAIEVEIFEDGVIGELLVEPGEEVPVGTALANVRSGAEAPEAEGVAEALDEAPAEPEAPLVAEAASAEAAAEPARAAPEPAPVGPEGLSYPPAPSTPVPPPTVTEPPRASPAARAHARELGVDLRAVRGTGRHGTIVKADVVAAASERARAEPEPVPAVASAPVPVPPAPAGERPHVTPRARRLALQLGVDPATVTGSGPGGSVTGDDIEAASGGAAPAEPAEPAPAEPLPAKPASRKPTGREKPSDERTAAMRRAIAAAMAKSKREIPHYYLGAHIDMETALTWLERTNLERPLSERILPAALLLRATAKAARDVPELNGFWQDDRFEPSDAVHLGVGISLRQGGLIAPAILGADAKGLPELMTNLRDLVARTRTLQLRSSEMSDATITVTALGDQGVETVYGVIYPPQVALVGFGRVQERPWAESGMLGVRRVVHVTLAADHRASDGHTGGLFLAAIDKHLQHPEEL